MVRDVELREVRTVSTAIPAGVPTGAGARPPACARQSPTGDARGSCIAERGPDDAIHEGCPNRTVATTTPARAIIDMLGPE
jgi:hypothetical protein